jgi:hypothetical protein
MEMIREAAARGDMEVVTKLMDLQERWEKNASRKAFNEAFAAFKTEILPVIRNKKITDGPLKGKKYAELFSVVQAVTPALGNQGLSASWDIVRDDKDWIEVACTVEHVQGHSRTVKMGGPPDTGGAKNAIQARISTVTYLERQTLKAVCGIAEQGDDSDGTGANDAGGPVNEQQLAELQARIAHVGMNIQRFCTKYRIEAVPDLPASKFNDAMAALDDYERRAQEAQVRK